MIYKLHCSKSWKIWMLAFKFNLIDKAHNDKQITLFQVLENVAVGI